MPAEPVRREFLESEIEKLPRCQIRRLRVQWRELFGRDPPPAFGPDLLRRSIAYKLQEDAYGGLLLATRRELDRLVAAIAKNPSGRIEMPRRIKAGAVLVREWKGKTHRVTVADKGFVYEARDYSSLSEIAREITGTRWNGPRFFGLRPNERLKPTDETAPRKRGRPRKVSTARDLATEADHGL
jgi:hypothetical protein